MPVLKTEIEDKILAAGLRIFSRKGLKGARMVEIAQEADLTRASLNYYFRSKEQLYLAVMKKGFGTLKANILAAITQTEHTYEEFVHALVEGLIQSFRKAPEMPFFLVNVNIESPERLVNEVFGELDPRKDLFAFVSAMLDKSIKEGKINPIEPIHFLENITSLCAFPFLNKQVIIRTMSYTPEQLDQFYVDRIEIVTQLMVDGYKVKSNVL